MVAKNNKIDKYITINIYILLMPKVVDNYVLERSIGKGQFGDVYKGFNKVNNLDIAIKTINRDKLKGIQIYYR